MRIEPIGEREIWDRSSLVARLNALIAAHNEGEVGANGSVDGRAVTREEALQISRDTIAQAEEERTVVTPVEAAGPVTTGELAAVNEAAALHEKNEMLREENVRLRAEFRRTRAEAKKLRPENTELRGHIGVVMQRESDLRAENERLREDLATERLHVVCSDQEVVKTLVENERLRARVAELEPAAANWALVEAMPAGARFERALAGQGSPWQAGHKGGNMLGRETPDAALRAAFGKGEGE